MKNLKSAAAVAAALALALTMLSGCAGTTAPAGSAGGAKIIVTDMMGREVSLDEPATRVVALDAANCEILYAVGAGDALVGRGEYCDYPAEVLAVPSVQSGAETNLEQIIALEPELLIMNTMAQTEEQVAALEKAGIAVAVTTAEDIEGVYRAVELVGALTGKGSEAGAVVSGMKETFAEIEEKSAGGGSVYFEVSPLEYGLWTAGSGTFMDEIAAMLGLENAFADVSGWAEISEEQVLERDPDYIVTLAMYFGEGLTPAEEICAREGWGNVAAVKNGAILNLRDNELSRPGPRLADGAAAMYEFVYGEELATSAA